MENSCKTCKKNPGCLYHSAAIFRYFIMTGRDQELPKDTYDINTSSFCGDNYELDETKVSEDQNSDS